MGGIRVLVTLSLVALSSGVASAQNGQCVASAAGDVWLDSALGSDGVTHRSGKMKPGSWNKENATYVAVCERNLRCFADTWTFSAQCGAGMEDDCKRDSISFLVIQTYEVAISWVGNMAPNDIVANIACAARIRGNWVQWPGVTSDNCKSALKQANAGRVDDAGNVAYDWVKNGKCVAKLPPPIPPGSILVKADAEDEIASECGNGILEENETCDDGNFAAGDGCSTACGLEEDPYEVDAYEYDYEVDAYEYDYEVDAYEYDFAPESSLF